MSKKYTPDEKAYVESMQNWFKSQQLCIESCDMSIRQSKEIIAISEARIAVESAELKSKVKHINEARKKFEAWKKNR